MKPIFTTLTLLFLSTLATAQKNEVQDSYGERLQAMYVNKPGQPGTDSIRIETYTLLEGQHGPVLAQSTSNLNDARYDIPTRTNENIDPRISTPHDWFSSIPSKTDSISDIPETSDISIKSAE